MKRTKIVASVGPSIWGQEKSSAMIEAGVDVFRLNFSHGSYEEHSKEILDIRAASRKTGRPVAIIQDLQGPKIRLIRP